MQRRLAFLPLPASQSRHEQEQAQQQQREMRVSMARLLGLLLIWYGSSIVTVCCCRPVAHLVRPLVAN